MDGTRPWRCCADHRGRRPAGPSGFCHEAGAFLGRIEITHVSNLPSVLQLGGLCCDNRRNRDGIVCKGIAYQHIKDRRARKRVPLGQGGTLADYVPFYFGPRSPMLYTINKGNVPGYSDGQSPVLHLVSSVEEIVEAGLPFVFTDGHAEMGYSDFFDDLSSTLAITRRSRLPR